MPWLLAGEDDSGYGKDAGVLASAGSDRWSVDPDEFGDGGVLQLTDAAMPHFGESKRRSSRYLPQRASALVRDPVRGRMTTKSKDKGETGVLFAEHDALDVVGAPGGSVAGDESGAHLGVSFGGFELAGHSGEESVED